MTDLLNIAKECGGIEWLGNDDRDFPAILITHEQLRATVEKAYQTIQGDMQNLLDIIAEWKRLGAIMDRDELIMVSFAADNLDKYRKLIANDK